MNKKNLTALVALATSACTGWRVESGPVPLSSRAIASSRTQALRVRLKNGAEVFLVMARVEGDSLIGYTRDNRKDFARAAFPVSEVRDVASFGLSGAKTAVLVLVILGSMAALVASCAAAGPL